MAALGKSFISTIWPLGLIGAKDTPWIEAMTFSSAKTSDKAAPNNKESQDSGSATTTAAFSPQSGYGPASSRARTTVLMQRKSPLLVATPPTVTRALAFSHPYILPLNKLLGLVSWTSGDPWESFLLVAGFWAIILYGDTILLWAGPIILVASITLAMYSRRYSPLSTRRMEKHKREPSESSMKHQKSLEEIVETLSEFTFRCNTLLEPFIQLTDFLSTQQTATSASTRSSLTTLLIRMLFITPFWMILALSPLQIITTRRTILVIGTLILTWYSRPARVSREILWRSQTIRHISSVITGLHLIGSSSSPNLSKGSSISQSSHSSRGTSSLSSSLPTARTGARFTFVVYENQRRWIGLGWTSSLLAYERAPWTDEHLNPSVPKEEFQLPAVDSYNEESASWRWVPNSQWKVEGAANGKLPKGGRDDGWIYYDNKWNDGRRGQDGWGRYTRRRKWYRDAELVDSSVLDPEEMGMASSEATLVPSSTGSAAATVSTATGAEKQASTDTTSIASSTTKQRRGFFGRRRSEASSAQGSVDSKSSTVKSSGGEEGDDYYRPSSHREENSDWGVGDDIRMGLG